MRQSDLNKRLLNANVHQQFFLYTPSVMMSRFTGAEPDTFYSLKRQITHCHMVLKEPPEEPLTAREARMVSNTYMFMLLLLALFSCFKAYR